MKSSKAATTEQPVCHHVVESGGRGCTCREHDAKIAALTAERDRLRAALHR